MQPKKAQISSIGLFSNAKDEKKAIFHDILTNLQSIYVSKFIFAKHSRCHILNSPFKVSIPNFLIGYALSLIIF